MDGARKGRAFAAYTTAQLEAYVADAVFLINCDHARVAAIRAEIARRKSGASMPFVTPQVPPPRR